jgi:EAL domain-containing protein (putative c-di-GMP-specific phosphodiesterase class I)
VALDDFGAGYTSLHALRELKFATLKIDRSFVDRCVEDTASAAIIHAVIGVGRSLGMKVVCEGIETAAQAEFLRIAGAHYLQGYHFHRPCAADDLLAGLARAA